MEKVKYQENEYEVKFLREAKYGKRSRKKHNGEITVAYIDLPNGHQLMGVAERSPRDDYDEVQATTVALGRLKKKIKKREKAKVVGL
jgi:hypothetical protein